MPETQRIVLTPGEPAGIGPDLVVQLAQQSHTAQLIVVADPDLLTERARLLGLPLNLQPYEANGPPTPHAAGTLPVLPISLFAPIRCGKPDPANADYVLETLRRAVSGCLQGEFSAMVTGPVHKGVLNRAGAPFTGHTEYLAQLTATPHPVMMLTTPGLRVALVTTHLPLAAVCQAITKTHLQGIVRTLHEGLQTYLGIDAPHIMVCGLNPHAGEQGNLGQEEQQVITPVLAALRHEGMNLTGPLPADSLFTPRYLNQADVVLAMYHDQGLTVLKHMGFEQVVNITLGLPIVRTSVGHGTALELAGTGQGKTDSFEAAIQTAIEMAAAGGEKKRIRRPALSTDFLRTSST